jgi:hypothetical protein
MIGLTKKHLQTFANREDFEGLEWSGRWAIAEPGGTSGVRGLLRPFSLSNGSYHWLS